MKKISFKSKTQRINHLLNFKINMSMKDSGKVIRETAEESSNGKMAPFIRGTGRIILLMAMGG
jgi:hypothetical protein